MIFNKKIIIIFSALLFNIFVNVKSAPPSTYDLDNYLETDKSIICGELERNMTKIQVSYVPTMQIEDNLKWVKQCEKNAKVEDISNLSQGIFELSLISNSVIVTDGYAPIYIVSKDDDGVMVNFANTYCANAEIKISYDELFSFVQSHKSKLVYKLPFSDIHELGFSFRKDRSTIYPVFEVNRKTSKQIILLSNFIKHDYSSSPLDDKYSLFSFEDFKLYNVKYNDKKYRLFDVVNKRSVDFAHSRNLFSQMFTDSETVYVSSPVFYRFYKQKCNHNMSENERMADKKLYDKRKSSNIYGTIEGKDLKSEDDFNKIPLAGARVFIDGIPSFSILRRNRATFFITTDSKLQKYLEYSELFQLMKERHSEILYISNFNEGLNFKCQDRECPKHISDRALDDFINLCYPECNMAADPLIVDEFTIWKADIHRTNIELLGEEILRLSTFGPIMIYIPKGPDEYLNYMIYEVYEEGGNYVRVIPLHTVPDKQGHFGISYDVPYVIFSPQPGIQPIDYTGVNHLVEDILSNLDTKNYDELYMVYFSNQKVKPKPVYGARYGGISYNLKKDRFGHGTSFWSNFEFYERDIEKFKNNCGFNNFFINDKQYFEKVRNVERAQFVKQEGRGGCWFSALLGLLKVKNIELDSETLKTDLKIDNMSELFASNLSYFVNTKLHSGYSSFNDSAYSSSEEFINSINRRLLSRINKKIFHLREENPKNPEQTIFTWWQKYHNIVINSMDDHVVVLVDMPDINTMIVEEWGIRYTINTRDFCERLKATYDFEGYTYWALGMTGIE